MHGSGWSTQAAYAFWVTLTKAPTTSGFASRYAPFAITELP